VISRREPAEPGDHKRRFRAGVLCDALDGEFGDRSETYSGTGRIRYTW
jgi:hypothetical protein